MRNIHNTSYVCEALVYIIIYLPESSSDFHFSILVYFFQDVQDVQDGRRLLVIMFWILCDFRSILFCNTPFQLYIYIIKAYSKHKNHPYVITSSHVMDISS